MCRISGGPPTMATPWICERPFAEGCNVHFIVGLMAIASLLVSYAYDPWAIWGGGDLMFARWGIFLLDLGMSVIFSHFVG